MSIWDDYLDEENAELTPEEIIEDAIRTVKNRFKKYNEQEINENIKPKYLCNLICLLKDLKEKNYTELIGEDKRKGNLLGATFHYLLWLSSKVIQHCLNDSKGFKNLCTHTYMHDYIHNKNLSSIVKNEYFNNIEYPQLRNGVITLLDFLLDIRDHILRYIIADKITAPYYSQIQVIVNLCSFDILWTSNLNRWEFRVQAVRLSQTSGNSKYLIPNFIGEALAYYQKSNSQPARKIFTNIVDTAYWYIKQLESYFNPYPQVNVPIWPEPSSEEIYETLMNFKQDLGEDKNKYLEQDPNAYAYYCNDNGDECKIPIWEAALTQLHYLKYTF